LLRNPNSKKWSLTVLARRTPLGAGLLIVAAWSGAICQSSYADIDFSFGTDQDHYDVSVGGSVPVQVYLYETVTGEDSSLLVAEDGLFQAQVTIERSGAVPTDPAILFDYTPNTAEFDDAWSPEENAFTESELDLTQFVDIDSIIGPTGVDLDGGVRRVWLLTATVQGGDVLGETTTFSVLDNPLFEDTFTFLGPDVLDPLIASAGFTVTTVPEPSSVLLLLQLGALCGIACWRRRRRGG
jgi:hypothetical protein